MRKLFLALSLFFGTVIVVLAQVPLPAPPAAIPLIGVAKSATVQALQAGTPSAPGVKAPAEAAPKAVEAPKEGPRLAKLKALTFDRRPSAILKSWAPEPKLEEGKLVPKDAKELALEKELAAFRKSVAVGDWATVKTYLASLPDEEAIVGYRQMLQSLQQSPGMNRGAAAPNDEMMQQRMMMMQGAQQFAEKNLFTMDDLFGIAAAAPSQPNAGLYDVRGSVVGSAMVAAVAPKGVEKTTLATLSNFVREAVTGGTLIEVVVDRFKTETAKPKGQAVFDVRQVAKLLTQSGYPAYAGDFLPTPEKATTDKDYEALNLLSRHFMALHLKEQKAGNLEKAWNAVQSVLAVPDGTREQQEEALLRAVELAPKVKDTLGQNWLDESFTKKPERGMDIIATVGTLVSQGISMKPFQTDERLNAIKLMKTAVEALLKAAPERAKQWKPTLTLLAVAWLKEAEFSRQYDRSTSSGGRMRRDMYGNIFYGNTNEDDDDGGAMRMMMMQNGNMPRPVSVGDVLRARPNDEWVKAVDDSIRPRLAELLARLHLKMNEEDKAFPLIKELAKAQKDEAKELVKEFLRVWIRNHDPNAARNENRYSWFFFSYEQRAEGIPLTRSKQERNLAELAVWIDEIRQLPIKPIDDEILVKAFTTCHSSAEVYKTEAIEKVFGPIEKLQPRTLAGLAQQMRGNLAGLWRDSGEQQKKKTNRKKKDLESEVVRGYDVARTVVKDGLKKFPNHWALLAAEASLIHDEVNYRQELAKSTDFTKRRNEAFALYKQAAAEYGKVVKAIPVDEQSNALFDQWFAASLGAVDLGMITEEKQTDQKQPALIREALQALPGEAATKHFDRFANDLFTRMSGAKPHVKFRYLKAGFEIVGDHKQAIEAKKLFDYYKDLAHEIKLDALVDGSTDVGHGKPFGLFVNIRHTRDIERESGGFSRYLQNQNSMTYSYNYGRPTADYRDRFEQTAKEALKEQFEVISVTFQEEKVTSRALPEFGWRYTPYAYILLKPRGPQVDKIPELRLDLDFLDTSGFVVLPVSSPVTPIDCRNVKGEQRPVTNLTVTQTLDERQADKGILLLEVKAVGVGLVPDLDQLATITPTDFDIVKTEEQGLAVKKFEEDLDTNAIVSERVWNLTLKGKDGLSELPKSFQFANVQIPTKEVLYQRYNDADLTTVEQSISLEKQYGQKTTLWIWSIVAGAAAFVVMLLMGTFAILSRSKKPVITQGLRPEDLNAFNVLGLLQQLRDNGQVSPAERADLDRAIETVEQHYFSNGKTPAPDLRGIATKWIGVA